MSKIQIKSPREVKIMAEGGKKLAQVKARLKEKIKVGANAQQIDDLAEKLILDSGGKPSFKMVPKYFWTTCVNVNEGVVHGIPKKTIVFKKGDLVSVDLGVYYKGFHTDTSFTVGLQLDKKTAKFMKIGKKALDEAIMQAKPGNRVYDISQAMEKRVKASGYSPVRALVGHGVGRELHEEPQIPCFTYGKRSDSPQLRKGMVIAIEVMYAEGKGDVSLEDDGWTISASDGTITALFEETIAITKIGPKVLTELKGRKSDR
jgi:methionyl aminopeptidase